MFEYYYNVSLNGRHLFRTDWYDQGQEKVAAALTAKFTKAEGYEVSEHKRSKSQEYRVIG